MWFYWSWITTNFFSLATIGTSFLDTFFLRFGNRFFLFFTHENNQDNLVAQYCTRFGITLANDTATIIVIIGKVIINKISSILSDLIISLTKSFGSNP
jgi:hypothetical protein